MISIKSKWLLNLQLLIAIFLHLYLGTFNQRSTRLHEVINDDCVVAFNNTCKTGKQTDRNKLDVKRWAVKTGCDMVKG